MVVLPILFSRRESAQMNLLQQIADTSTKHAARSAADRLVAGLPAIDGEVDGSYLSDALGRAGRPTQVRHLEASRLDGGRISANIFSLKADAGAFVLKKFVPEPWRVALFGTAFNEPALWAGGLTRNLPERLSCPTIDVALHRARGECWMLMDDVSAGVAPRGAFDAPTFRVLLDGLARLHGQYWEQTSDLDDLPVLTLDQHTAMFTDPCAAVGGRVKAAGWIAEVLDKVFLFRTFVPVLLEVLGSNDGDFYLDLCQHRDRWLAPLSRSPQTLIHGDLRRANIAALPSGQISLFDWDFACRAPAAADLTHYWFLHFWCYPPRDGLTPEDRAPLRAYYTDRLDETLGGRLDRREFGRVWDLCWLKAFAQIGFCMVDALVGTPSADEVARVRTLCAKAIAEAKRITDAYAA
jgi:hypothetical protein